MIFQDSNNTLPIWLMQKMIGTLHDVETQTTNYQLKEVFGDSESEDASVIRRFRITEADGKSYDTPHYSLPAIISVGYTVNCERAVRFRMWATGIIEQFTIKAYVMDDERIKAGGSMLTDQRLSGCGRGHGTTQDPDDDARLGDPPEPLHRSD